MWTQYNMCYFFLKTSFESTFYVLFTGLRYGINQTLEDMIYTTKVKSIAYVPAPCVTNLYVNDGEVSDV